MAFEPTLLLAYLAGVLTITTPCCLPMLPPLLAGSVGHRLKPLFIAFGASVSFTLMGGLFSVMGWAVGGFGDAMRLLSAWVIIALGAVMVDRDVRDLFTRRTSGIVNRFHAFFSRRYELSKERPLLGAFILGLSLGFIWIPCIGPILGAILTFVVYQGDIARGSLLLFVYSLGFGTSMLALAYGGRHFSGRVEWTRRNSQLLYKVAGWVLIIMGIAIMLGVYKYMQKYFYPYAVYLEERFIPR